MNSQRLQKDSNPNLWVLTHVESCCEGTCHLRLPTSIPHTHTHTFCTHLCWQVAGRGCECFAKVAHPSLLFFCWPGEEGWRKDGGGDETTRRMVGEETRDKSLHVNMHLHANQYTHTLHHEPTCLNMSPYSLYLRPTIPPLEYLFSPLLNSNNFSPCGMLNTQMTVPYSAHNQAVKLRVVKCVFVPSFVSSYTGFTSPVPKLSTTQNNSIPSTRQKPSTHIPDWFQSHCGKSQIAFTGLLQNWWCRNPVLRLTTADLPHSFTGLRLLLTQPHSQKSHSGK